jgi:AraC-like DNA-binding protein
MDYKQYSVPPALQQYVRYFWSFDSLQSNASTLHIKSFADKYPRLIFQDLTRFNPICNEQGEKMPICYLSGIDTKNSAFTMGGTFSHFGVSFYPHALNAFFRIDADELINELPDINLLCHSDIQNKLLVAQSHIERTRIISDYLYIKIQTASESDPLINHIIQGNEIHETAHVFNITRKYKVSERQLERKFNMAVGVSPKKLQRIARFEKSLHLLAHANYKQLTAIGYHLGYTDQSHFIKDFKTFSGMTPYEFIKNQNFGSESSSFIYNPDSTS